MTFMCLFRIKKTQILTSLDGNLTRDQVQSLTFSPSWGFGGFHRASGWKVFLRLCKNNLINQLYLGTQRFFTHLLFTSHLWSYKCCSLVQLLSLFPSWMFIDVIMSCGFRIPFNIWQFVSSRDTLIVYPRIYLLIANNVTNSKCHLLLTTQEINQS